MRDSMHNEINKDGISGGINTLEYGSKKAISRGANLADSGIAICRVMGQIMARMVVPIGRRGFIEGYFILSLMALSFFALFLYHYADVAESPQKLLRGIANLILERNFYLAIVMLFFLSFGILYLLRIRDSRLSPMLKGLFFLPLFLFYLSAAELILVLTNTIVETNFLQMIAAIKRFSQTANGESFSQIIPQSWILLLKEGAWRFQLLSLLHLLVLILPLLLPASSSLDEKRYTSTFQLIFIIFLKILHYLFFTLALLWFLSSLLGWGYLTYLTFQMESGVQYLEDYQRFQTLLGG